MFEFKKFDAANEAPKQERDLESAMRKIKACRNSETIDELMNDSEFLGSFDKNETLWPIFIEKLAFVIWHENADKNRNDSLFSENDWLYNNLKKYEEAVLQNTDFVNSENFLKTEVYLNFINNLHLYSESVWPVNEVAHGKFKHVTGALRQSLLSEQCGYFISIRGENVLKNLDTLEIERDKGVDSDFEHRTSEHEAEQLPFEIAQDTFAIFDERGFLISDPSDHETIKRLMDEFKDKADVEFFEELHGEWRTRNDAVYRQAERILLQIKGFINKPLKLEQFVIENDSRNHNDADKNEENLADYRYLMTNAVRTSVEKDFNFSLNGLSFAEQFYFLDYIKRINKEEMESAKMFFNDFSIAGAKIFLAMEIDRNNGDKILNIYKKIGKESMALVVSKIAEISELAERKSGDLQNIFLGSYETKKAPHFQIELLRKAHEIIKKFSDVISGEQVDEEKINTLLSDLEKSKTEIILLAAGLKAAKEKGEAVDLESIKNLDLSIKDFGSELSEEEKQEMLSVAERNWNQDPELKDKVLEGLRESLQDTTNQKFYVLKFQEKIAAFVRFEKTERGTLYAGSFNVDPDARGLGIGDEMMDEALKAEARENVLEATVSPKLTAGTAYVERVGFVIDGIIADYHHTGKPLFSIQIDNKKNESYAYRNEGKKNEIGEDDLKKQCASLEMLEHLIGSESFVLRFDMKNDFDEMKKAMEKLLIAKDDDGKDIEGQSTQNKYRITRYFREDKRDEEKDFRYFVFERMR